MNHLRQASILLVGGLFVSLLAPSCTTVGDDDAAECKEGTKNCGCKSDDRCDSGLVCNGSGKCVSGGAGTGGSGQGGSAGASTTTGGAAGRSNGGRAGSESFSRGGTHPMGGTTQEAGAGGEPGTGGSLVGRGGSSSGGDSGSGNANGQAGEGTSGEGGEPGTGGTGGSAGMGGHAGSPPCTTITVGEISDVTLGAGENATYLSPFTPALGAANLEDGVALQLYDGVLGGINFHGADYGTFTLGTGDDANYKTCSRCLVAGVDDTDKWFLATEGTLTFTTDSDQMNGSPKGTLRNVVLREATYDTNTYESTFVEGGDCLTFANGDVLVNHVEEPPPEVPANWNCVPAYYNDGTWCDCGCGALDLDCASADNSVCEYCYCNLDDDMDCTAVNATENNVCN